MQKQKPNTLPATTTRLALGIGGILILLALLFALPPSNNATANSNDKSQAISKYPFISGTRLDSCSLCHTSSIPSLNPYGSAYLSNGRNLNAFGLIENLDSDGDGFTNIQELNALFFPGDPGDHPPVNTSTPTRTSTSIPPTPTRTNTSVPPTPTRTSTSVPPTPTRTNTSLPPTPTQTYTSVPPTATPVNTVIPPTPTSTSLPPSPTQTSMPPSATPIGTIIPPTPTSTSLPPTLTPTSLPPSATPTGTLIPPTPTNTSLPPTPTPTSIPPSSTPTPTQLPPSPTAPAPSPTATPPPTEVPHGLNLDIRLINITPQVRLGDKKLITISVQLWRLSNVGGEGTIKVTGIQNGVRIYYGIRTIEIDEKGEAKWFTLPNYTPTQTGTIHWKIQVIDDHPDGDVRTTTTKVTSSRDHDRENEDHDRENEDHDRDRP